MAFLTRAPSRDIKNMAQRQRQPQRTKLKITNGARTRRSHDLSALYCLILSCIILLCNRNERFSFFYNTKVSAFTSRGSFTIKTTWRRDRCFRSCQFHQRQQPIQKKIVLETMVMMIMTSARQRTTLRQHVEATVTSGDNDNNHHKLQREREQICKEFLETSGILQETFGYESNRISDGENKVLTGADDAIRIQPLGDGFANWVFKVDVINSWVVKLRDPRYAPTVEKERNEQFHSFVVKIFSPMAKQRIDYPTRGYFDAFASTKIDVGPTILYRDENGIIMEYINGCVLTEEDVHGAAVTDYTTTGAQIGGRFGDGRHLCISIAKKVAQLHSTVHLLFDPVSDKDDNDIISNMLWHSLARMMDYIKTSGGSSLLQKEDLKSSSSSPVDIDNYVLSMSGWTFERIENEIQLMHQTLDDLGLPLVLAHGDLKPSNIIVAQEVDNNKNSQQQPSLHNHHVVLIDFELGGLNYRGYDIFKLFRTSSNENCGHGQYPKNMKAFVEAYVEEMRQGQKEQARDTGGHGNIFSVNQNGEMEADNSELVDLIICETLLFEPLTWLEAGVFYLFATKGDAYQKERWTELALDRFENYEISMGTFQNRVDHMKKVIRNRKSYHANPVI
uniref:ethanolamine kinase n=1 Tax=Ditylum brightwellii TaxID=49249 RepID=A0A7S4S7S5_9STRA